MNARNLGHRLAVPLVALLIAIFALSGVAFVPAATASAAEVSITVTPNVSTPGGQVTVAGSGFAPNEVVALLISPQTNPVRDIRADGNGAVPPTAVTLDATTFGPGSHTLTLYGSSTHRQASASLTVTVGASITVTPSSISPGGQVTVSGAGFAPNEVVALLVSPQSNPVRDIRADGNGAVPATIVTLNATAFGPGNHTLTLYGSSTHRQASANLTIVPTATRITVTPNVSTPGGQVTVAGSGFAPNEVVALLISPQTNPVRDIRADGNGAVPPTAVTLDATTFGPGSHTLTLYGSSTHRQASAQITVTTPTDASATLAVTPATTNRGGLITVSGSQWASGEPVVVSIKGLAAPLATITATAQGVLSPTGVTIPYGVPLGPQALQVTGSFSKRTITTGITVQPLNPSISLSATAATAGSTITVTGKGFGTSEQVTLSLNGAALPTAPAVITTTGGAFTATFTVPSSVLSGSNTVSAIGNESRVSAVAILTGTLPTATTLYFAGASTLPGSHSALPILNTNAQPAHVELTFYYDSGAPGHASLDVPPHSRATADLDKLAGANHSFGLKLTAATARGCWVSARPIRRGTWPRATPA